MFLKTLYTYGNLENFNYSDLLISLFNHFYIVFYLGYFTLSPNIVSGLMILMIIIFNHFHFKISLKPNQKLALFHKTEFEGEIECQFKEKFIFKINFYLSLFLVPLYSLAKIIKNPFFPNNNEDFNSNITIIKFDKFYDS